MIVTFNLEFTPARSSGEEVHTLSNWALQFILSASVPPVVGQLAASPAYLNGHASAMSPPFGAGMLAFPMFIYPNARPLGLVIEEFVWLLSPELLEYF